MFNWLMFNFFAQLFQTPPTADSELKDNRKGLIWSVVGLLAAVALFVSCFVVPIQSDAVIFSACLFFILFSIRTVGFSYEVIKWSKICAKGHRYIPLHKLPEDIKY